MLSASPSFGGSQPNSRPHQNANWSADGLSGLLFSQVGYEVGYPVRVVVRLPQKNALPAGAVCELTAADNQEKTQQTPCTYWGEIWKSHWWVAEFPANTEAGEWEVAIRDGSTVLMQDSGLKIGQDILWNETMHLASVDILERRLHFTKVGAGWQDAGTLWVESPAQSAMIIALNELQEQCGEYLEPEFIQRLHQQLTVGCDYLVMTQAKAEELGFPKGAMSHDLLGHEKDILPHDAAKAVVALLQTVQTLPDTFQEKKGPVPRHRPPRLPVADHPGPTHGRLRIQSVSARLSRRYGHSGRRVAYPRPTHPVPGSARDGEARPGRSPGRSGAARPPNHGPAVPERKIR